MKPGRLYIRIFLSFVVLLIITEIAIFGFFILFSGRYSRERFEKENLDKLTMSLQLIETEMRAGVSRSVQQNPPLQELVNRLGKVFRAKIWLTTSDNHVLLKSFPEKIPRHLIEKIQQRADDYNKRPFFRFHKTFLNLYFVEPLPADQGRPMNLHVLFLDHLPDHGGVGFAVGLLSIGVFAALLVIPVSRRISRPVKSLTRSAVMIEQGNLSHRATITTRDEIGELGQAFNRMAEKVESMVRSGKELTAQISHELRSPLARIQLAVEIIRDQLQGGESLETTEHFESVRQDIEELDHLIGRILALSKLDLQETDDTIDLFSPVVELEKCLDKYRPMLENKSIPLETRFAVRPQIYGNRETFATVMANVVDNALKYSPPGEPVRVGSEQRGEALLLTITNSAPHVSADDLDRIFEPFYRAEPGGQSGAGLGLAISRKIVEKHGGTITARQMGTDIEIEIRLPLA
ncbi:HAMP domain-containing histidine kinase [bacterium]|nr:HAMP domain-containing histidine kinase [bacterium]